MDDEPKDKLAKQSIPWKELRKVETLSEAIDASHGEIIVSDDDGSGRKYIIMSVERQADLRRVCALAIDDEIKAILAKELRKILGEREAVEKGKRAKGK